MIRLSKLTDYAVVILAEMAGQKGTLLSATALAEKTAMPEPTVGKILKTLARENIVESVRGAHGGYVLNKPARQLMVTDIITAMEGPIALTACVEDSNDNCALSAVCCLQGRWNPVNVAIKTALESVSLADMLAPRTTLGIQINKTKKIRESASL